MLQSEKESYTLNEVLKVPSRAQTTASKVSIPRKFASSALRLVQPRAGCAHTHLDLARDSDTIQLSVVFPRFRKRRPFRTFSNTQQATKPRLNQPQTALHNNERQQQHNNTVDPCMDSYLHMTIRVNSAYPAALNAKVSVVDTQHALDFCHSSFCLLRAGACLLHQREPSHLSPLTHTQSLNHSITQVTKPTQRSHCQRLRQRRRRSVRRSAAVSSQLLSLPSPSLFVRSFVRCATDDDDDDDDDDDVGW